jgi:1-acyl-sn-glycerol-3-phosphate acyltransferase
MLYFFRLLTTVIWVSFSCLVGIIVGIFRPFDPRNNKVSTRLINYGDSILGIQVEVRNKEILDSIKTAVFISNHQDNLDIFPCIHALPDKTVTIGKRSILFIPFFGIFFWLSGNIFINRKNKKRAFEAMDTAANAIKDKKISVWIMPEGTRSRGRGVLPFKKGAFVTAIKAQVPIVPIAISSYTKHLKLDQRHAGKIIVKILDPIPTIGLTMEDVDKILNQSYQGIKGTVQELDNEIEGKTEKI